MSLNVSKFCHIASRIVLTVQRPHRLEWIVFFPAFSEMIWMVCEVAKFVEPTHLNWVCLMVCKKTSPEYETFQFWNIYFELETDVLTFLKVFWCSFNSSRNILSLKLTCYTQNTPGMSRADSEQFYKINITCVELEKFYTSLINTQRNSFKKISAKGHWIGNCKSKWINVKQQAGVKKP